MNRIRSVLVASLVAGLALAGCSKQRYPKKLSAGGDPPNTPCASSKQCQVWGWCEDQAGQCVAANDEQCRASEACKKGGLCSLSGNRCVAKQDDCERSEWCDKFDLCDEVQGVCK